LQIPLTLSIIAGLTVEVSGQRFAIPQGYVEEIVQASAKALDFTRMGEATLVTFRGNRIPCLMLAEVLGLETPGPAARDLTLVLLRLASGDLFALVVERIHSHGDLVVKPLAPAVMKLGLYAGSTLLDDGQPVLLLDVTNIAAMHDLVSDGRARMLQPAEEEAAVAAAPRAMLFTDFTGRRCAVRLELVQRIETAPASALDRSAARARMVIDGAILPLVGLPDGPVKGEKLRLLRLGDGASEMLHAVCEIEDAVELTEALVPVPEDPLVEAMTLVEGRPVALLDAHELFARYGEPPLAAPGTRPRCALPDTEWARSILAPLVTSAGYEVVSGADEDPEVVKILSDDVFEAAEALGRVPAGPVIRLRDHPGQGDGGATIYRYDREALLAALAAARHARIAGRNRS
jgi:two-component system chemotaxis sensor kinase CheA